MEKFFCLIAAFLLFTGCSGKNKPIKSPANEKVTMQEQYRPQIHFTPLSGWMNDPNGMVYHDGEYHLFYQHNPFGKQWGNMSWGHAISTDLMHWKHQPVALSPDSLGYIFSGSAVVDRNNTSGLGVDGQSPLVAFFTYHNMDIEKNGGANMQTQGLAFSNDKGRTWIKYDGNPVIENPGIRDFRDPKVFRHEKSGQWIMLLAAGQVIQFWVSPNCLDWTYLSEFGKDAGNHDGVWECPDLFPLRVRNTGENKWVLIVNVNPGGPAGGSAAQYFVGGFDGKKFTSDQKMPQWVDYGKDNYAGVTWSNTPDNRRIFLGWMNNWQYAGKEPTLTWSGAATFPRELGLVKDSSTYLLTSTPVNEINAIRGKTFHTKQLTIEETLSISDSLPFRVSPLEIKLIFDNSNTNREESNSEKYGICLKNRKGEYISVGYNRMEKFFYIDRTNATGATFSDKFAGIHNMPCEPKEPTVDWHLIIDECSLEFFAAGYRVVMTDVFYPSEPFDTIELFARNGAVKLVDACLTELISVWNQPQE
ncbi:MAG: glycoside hydrolase family 32 protein [Tannerellaceae bacterium]|nr:glycoside hydrolase family 32 protein [Tannerellaceae bacterium]